jgi:hypothetical protein
MGRGLELDHFGVGKGRQWCDEAMERKEMAVRVVGYGNSPH